MERGIPTTENDDPGSSVSQSSSSTKGEIPIDPNDPKVSLIHLYACLIASVSCSPLCHQKELAK